MILYLELYLYYVYTIYFCEVIRCLNILLFCFACSLLAVCFGGEHLIVYNSWWLNLSSWGWRQISTTADNKAVMYCPVLFFFFKLWPAWKQCLVLICSSTAVEDVKLWDRQVKSCWNSSGRLVWWGYSNVIGPISAWLDWLIMKWSDRHI